MLSNGFLNIKNELNEYIRRYYSEVYSDVNDVSIGSMYIDLISYASQNLLDLISTVYNEQDVEFAKLKKSLYTIARKRGVYIPRKSTSYTIVDISATVPANGEGPDQSYMPLILRGAQVIGSGNVFEVENDIDFTNPLSVKGTPNRTIEPIYNVNGTIVSYKITKREIASNGRSKFFIKKIGVEDTVPFYKVVLPDQDVIEVTDVVTLPGVNYNRTPSLSEMYNQDNRWDQVENFSVNKIFADSDITSGIRGVRRGVWKDVSRKYVVNYTDKGYLYLTFGDGYIKVISNNYVSDSSLLLRELEKKVNTNYLGEKLSPNTTLFIRYRVGGGLKSNIGVNGINSFGDINVYVNGNDRNINQNVSKSLEVTNPVASIGGKDEPTLEEIRNIIKKYKTPINAANSLYSYNYILNELPPKYTLPYRYSIISDENKAKIFILTLNSEGKLNSSSSQIIKENILNYLYYKKGMNDYIEIIDGKIINLKVEFFLTVEPFISNQQQMFNSVNDKMNLLFSPQILNMGQDVFVGNILKEINSIEGVINVDKINFYNPINGVYSTTSIGQPVDATTRLINLLDQNTLFCDHNQMFEIKSNNDIIINLRSNI